MSKKKEDIVVAASAARTADDNFTFYTSAVGGIFVIDVTAATATPSVVFTIQGVEPLSGNTFQLLQSAAITATGTTALYIHPSIPAVANTKQRICLPGAINIFANHADTDSITYSIRFVGVS